MRRLRKTQKRAFLLTQSVFRPAASGADLPRNILWANVMRAKNALSAPRQNIVTYNNIAIIFPLDMVGSY
jgi:hypothetical protein